MKHAVRSPVHFMLQKLYKLWPYGKQSTTTKKELYMNERGSNLWEHFRNISQIYY